MSGRDLKDALRVSIGKIRKGKERSGQVGSDQERASREKTG